VTPRVDAQAARPAPPRVVTATYRLQLTRQFPFAAARALVPYFEQLGVSHLYLSPVLAARPGSQHGYDVIDHSRLNAELGTEDDLRALATELHARKMGIILDMVPNHMSASEDNPYWDDVLQRGRSSRYAEWFDIDWAAPHAEGKVILPLLGAELDHVIAHRELKLHIRDSGSRVAYFDRTFPLDPATLPKEIQLAQFDPAGRPAAEAWAAGAEGHRRLRHLLDQQNYRLKYWKDAQDEINYRRFFDVDDLVALRMETEQIFDATHRLILEWVRDGVVDGLRVDHVDGLRAPSWYLAKLRAAVDTAKHKESPARFPIFVEKILSSDETLPSEWPVEGSTGYDFLNDVEELFIDAAGLEAIEASYRAQRRNPQLDFTSVAREGKRRALAGALRADVLRLARIAHEWRAQVSEADFAVAISELIVHLDVYRTYLSEPGLASEADRRSMTAAMRGAREIDGVSAAAVAELGRAFFADPTPGDVWRTELVMRFQQTSGPAAAKGIEDTALYVYTPLASRNEVGGKPDRPLTDVAARMHARNANRLRDWPRAMLAVNTHDTKRSADIRSRLDVLTTIPVVWTRHVTRWRRLNKPRKKTVRGKPSPDTNLEYLYYQTLLGLWPAPRPKRRADDLPDRAWLGRARKRLVTYMLKAAREAKTRTSWTESDQQYEKVLDEFVRETLAPGEDAPFLGDVARLTAQTADDGFRFSLARLLLHCLSPGVPDIYQGDELWNFTLVDPDNRRPVDFQRRGELLAASADPDVLRHALESGGERALMQDEVKLALLVRLLRFRRDHASLVVQGEYLPLLPQAEAGVGLFAFARQLRGDVCLAVARTHATMEGKEPPAGSASLPAELAGHWHSVLTGREIELVRVEGQVAAPVSDLIAPRQPCELLLRRQR